MAITTLDGYIAATKQKIAWSKTTTRTTIANAWFSLFDIAGQPGAGTLAAGNTANGLVPTDATAGYPLVTAFGGSAGYLGRVEYGSTVACRIALFDRLFVAGAYAFNANTALASQPSFSGRVPGAIYTGLELWVEQVTAATGNQTVNVTYTDQDNNAGATTGAVGIGAAPTVGRCWQLPLAAGDSGARLIQNVVGTVATAGTFNVMVLRPLWSGRVVLANFVNSFDALQNGLPEIFADSAFYAMISADSTSSGLPECSFQVVNG